MRKRHKRIFKRILTIILIIITITFIIQIGKKIEIERQRERERRQTLKQINILGREYSMIRVIRHVNPNIYVYVDKDGNEIEIERHMAGQYKILEK